MPRLPAVLITAVLSFALIGIIVWIIVTQTLGLRRLCQDIRDNIETKLRAVGPNHALGFETITGTIQELTDEVYKLLPAKLDEHKLLPVAHRKYGSRRAGPHITIAVIQSAIVPRFF